MPPHRWRADSGTFHTVLPVGRRAADFSVRQGDTHLSVRVASFQALGRRESARARATLRRMLRLDEDLSNFYELCRGHAELDWVARRGAGVLLRSATPFEDLVKVLLTTNCNWANTRGMLERLTRELGVRTPSGARAFPSASRVAKCSPSYLKETIRVGYRAQPLLLLARRFARPSSVSRFERLSLSEQALRDYVLALPGFGPYAAGQILRLAGHYTDFALDSWCVATLKKRGFRTSSCTERALARRYRRFGDYRGLAFWLELTAPWHAEGPYADHGVEPLTA